MEQLILLLKSFYPMSSGLEAYLREKIKPFTFQPNEFIEKYGKVANLILFVESGLVKSTVNIKGKDVCYWFMKEGNIIIAVESFLLREDSEEWIQAIEPCQCWGFTWEELQETYRLFPEFLVHGLLITNKYYCLDRKRDRSKLQQEPDDTYADLMRTDPDLINRVGNEDMASYLDISIRSYQYVRSDYANPGQGAARKAKKKAARDKKKGSNGVKAPTKRNVHRKKL